MDSLKIESGVKEIAINGDPDRIIRFNPNDLTFVDRLYVMIADFQENQADWQRRAEELDAAMALDENGLPSNMPDQLAFMHELIDDTHAKIDAIFGQGTSVAVFQGIKDPDLIGQFFEGVLPFIEKARSDKLAKYARPGKGGKVMRKR